MNITLRNSLFSAAFTAACIMACYFFVDRPIAEAAHLLKNTIWHTLAGQVSLCASSKLFTILLASGFLVGALDAACNGLSHRSKSILYICTTVASAMLIGDVLKDIFGRARPPLLFEKSIYGFFPMTGEYLYYSFPSGHSIRIFSAMTAIGFVVPKLRLPALSLAVLVGVSRVLALKHYPSDVIFGAVIGITAALWGWKILYPYGYKKTA